MNNRRFLAAISLSLILVLLGISLAQWERGFRRNRRNRGRSYDGAVDRRGVPNWKNDEQFKDDVFTFVRVRYNSYGWRDKWATDYPDSDLNFSYRLQELTSLHVDPNGKILSLTDEELFDYPFLYLIEPGEMILDEAEVESLRRYLFTGGFLMIDDFWGEREWYNLYEQMKRVFPDREPIELPLEHEIFHNVYDLKVKPQIPSIHTFYRGYRTERGDATEAHYKAFYDDNERMVVLICHNTDLGDGWEREGEDPEYFRQYSEKYSYPLGINIVTYAMTH